MAGDGLVPVEAWFLFSEPIKYAKRVRYLIYHVERQMNETAQFPS